MIKKRPSLATYVSFVVVAGALALAPSWAQIVTEQPSGAPPLVSALPVEPASSLLAIELGDAEVEAFAQGFWEASALTSGSWSLGSDEPGFNAVPFLFTQTPDLYVFLRLQQKWLFEAYVTQAAADSLFSLVYEGDEREFIRSARVGNVDITMSDYPYMAFGTLPGSFGAAFRAYDAERAVSIDAMVRWDGLAWKTRSFFGSAEALEELLVPGDDLRGRRFVLPDAPVVSLALTDTTASDGSRVLRSDEYSVALATGVVLLAAEPAGTLSAAYLTAGGVVRSEQLYAYGTDADGDEVRQDNPLEARNLYALADTDSARQLFVRNLATGATDPRFEVVPVSSGLIQVVRSGAVPDSGNEGYMRPFADDTPWIYEPDDGGDRATAAGDGFSIVARVVESVDTIVLDEATVAGTISVYRDGVESASFVYDESARTLVMTPAPRAGESVQVRYAVASSDRSDGALAFGLGSRFPWLGLDWSTAVGGRWPLFGLGYDEGGELKSAWTGVSAGVSGGNERTSFVADAMARYLRAGASGIYRIAGMEDGDLTDFLDPFRATDGDVEGIVASSESAPDLPLETAFAALLDELHPAEAANRALLLEVDAAAGGDRGAETRLVRYVDYVPLSLYEHLSFFIKADGVPAGSSLELRVGDGQGGGASVMVPLEALGDGWRKVELELGPSPATTVYSADGSIIPVLGVSGTYAAVGSAGLVEIIVTGLTGGSVLVDEVLLEGSRDGFSVLAGATFALGDATKRSGPFLVGSASGVLDGSPSAASSLEAGWVTKAIDVVADWTPAYASGTGSYGLGYVVALPGRAAPTRLVDQFSRDEFLGRYARTLEAALALGSFSASAKARSAEESAFFGQEWTAATALGSLLTTTATASLGAPVAVIGDLDYADAWTESWRLVLPSAESDASYRRIEVSAQSLGSRLSATAKRSYDSPAVAVNSMEAKASLPLTLGAVSFSPYYTRSTSVERPTESASLSGDAAEFVYAATGGTELWKIPPFVELWNGSAFSGFPSFASGASEASHAATLGFELRRSIGYGLLDLFVPASVAAGFSRSVSLASDTIVESSVGTLTLSGGAANVFGASGARPVFSTISFDEYSHKTSLSLTYFPSDGAILPALSSNLAVSFQGLTGSLFAATSNLSYARTRSAGPWSEALSLALTTRPSRTWLGDLAGLAIRARTSAAAAAAAEPEFAAQSTWVSAWFDSMFEKEPSLRDSFGFEASVGRAASNDAPLAVRIALDYRTRVVAGGALSLGAGAGLWQLASIDVDGAAWGFGYTFSLEAKVVF